MKRNLVATAAVACVLALSGCSAGATDQPAPTTSGPEVPTSPATSIVPPARIPSTPPETGSASPTDATGTASTQAYCQQVKEYQQQATEALNQLPKEPQALRENLAKLQGAREQLRSAASTAPEPLKESVKDQVDALDELVAQARSGDLRSINPDKYTQAAREFSNECNLGS